MNDAHHKQSDSLRRSIDRHEEELERALSELKRATQQRLTLRHYMANEPWKWLLRACALGLFLGVRAARRRDRVIHLG